MISKIGFIGAGKVGTSLGKYFTENDIDISGYYSRTKSHSADSANFTNSKNYESINDLVSSCDTIFLTVPDSEISIIWEHIKSLDLKGKNIVHTCGAMSSEVFEGADECGAYAYSLHPMCAISSRKESWPKFSETYFTVEGNSKNIEDFKILMSDIGNSISEIDAESKVLYHAAAVFVSNLVIGVVAAGKDIFDQCGFEEEFSKNAWKSLFKGNAENIVNKDLVDALTGPVERADSNTIRKHLDSLEGRNERIYVELSRMILDIAKLKNPNRDYTEIEKELN